MIFDEYEKDLFLKKYYELCNRKKYKDVIELVLSRDDYSLYFINKLLFISEIKFFNYLDYDDINNLFNERIFKFIDKHKLECLIYKVDSLPNCIRNNINYIFDNCYCDFSNLNYDDCKFVLESYLNYSSDTDDFYDLCSKMNLDNLVKLVDETDLFSDKNEAIKEISLNSHRFINRYFNLSNINIIKDYDDKTKSLIIRFLNYDLDFINNKDYLDIITSILDNNIYLSTLYKIERFVDISYINRIRRKFIRNNINKYKYNNLLDIIISYLFEDYYKNVCIDINELIRYNSKVNIIDDDRIKFYKLVLDLNNISDMDKISFFNKFKNLDIKSMFYDDMRILKNDSYSNLMSNSLKLNDDIYDSKLSNKYNKKIYHLSGEDFFGLVKCFSDSDDINFDEVMNCKDGYSFSYISSNCMGTILGIHETLLVLFECDDFSNIVHVNNSDSWSNYSRINNYASDYVNRLYDSNELIQDTILYNEIVIAKNSSLKPVAYICFDNISIDDIKISNNINLPILLIDRRLYDEKRDKIRNNEDRYRKM